MDTTPGIERCSSCGATIHPRAPAGLCGRCLLRLGLEQGATPPQPAAETSDFASILLQPAPATAVKFHAFGDYELLEETGRGGMGVVFRARQASLDRVVAVKLIQAGRLASETEIQRFRAEARMAATLQHPGIVAVHEVAEVGGQHYFVMEYVEGCSLDQLNAGCGVRDAAWLRRAAILLKQIAEAVHYAHQRGILHRDLKPSNVLVDSAGRPRVTDFGLARRLEGDSRLTASDTVLGSPSYMSPEQAAGRASDVTTATDVYSLGAILYELLTGQPPFQGATPMETTRRVMDEEPRPPQHWNRAVDRDLATICLKCLEKDPGRRYASANVLVEELDRWLAREPILARPVGGAEKLWRWCQRQPALASLSGALLLLLVAVAVGASVATLRITAARDAERSQRLRAEAEMRRAGRAEADALARLHEAKLNYVRANRLTGRPGQRLDSLSELARAAARTNSLELRDEAIACLTLPDLRLRKRWGLLRWEQTGLGERFAFTSSFRFYGTNDALGNVVVRATDTDAVQFQIPTSGAPLAAALGSPDDRLLATIDRSGRALLWTLPPSEPSRLNVPPGAALLSFTPDSRALVVQSANGSLHFLNTANGAEEKSFPCPSAHSWIWLDPSGERLLAFAGRLALVLSAADGQRLRAFAAPDEATGFSCAAWHPDGRRLALASLSRIGIWDSATGRQLAALEGHEAPVAGLAFTDTGEYLVSASWDNTTRLWHLDAPREVLRLPSSGRDLRLNSDAGRLSFKAWNDTEVQLLDLALPRVVQDFDLPPPGPHQTQRQLAQAVFSPGGELVAAPEQEGVFVLQPPHPAPVALLPVPDTEAVAFSPGGTALFTGAADGLWRWPMTWSADRAELRLGPPAALAPTRGERVSRFDLSRDGAWLVASMKDNFLVLRLDHPEIIIRSEARIQPGTMPALSPDGSLAATTATPWHGQVQIWSPLTGALITNLPVFHAYDAVFSPDGRWLVCAALDATTFWQTADWSLRHHVPHPPDEAIRYHAAFSPGGRMVAVTASDRATRLVAVETGVFLATLTTGRLVNSLRFDGTGTRLVVGHEPGHCQLWDLSRLREELAALRLDWEDTPRPSRPSSTPPPLHVTVVGPAGAALPDDIPLIKQRGLDFLQSNLWTQAIAEFSRVIAWSPADGDAYLQRARAYRRGGQLARAAADLESAMRMAPRHSGAKPMPDPARVASIVFGPDTREHGLSVRPNDDGVTAPAQIGGLDCVRGLPQPGKGAFVYFAIDPDYKKTRPMTVRIEVEYFDAGAGSFGIQYDAASPRDTNAGSYTWALESKALTGNRTWNTVHFDLLDAEFLNSQNAHADFRLAYAAQDFYLRRVTLTPLVLADDATRPHAAP